MIEKIK